MFNTSSGINSVWFKLILVCYSPDSADSDQFQVQIGDIIIVATDGLFDNINEDMILRHTSMLEVTSVTELIETATVSIRVINVYMNTPTEFIPVQRNLCWSLKQIVLCCSALLLYTS